jgi:hypothetical protein
MTPTPLLTRRLILTGASILFASRISVSQNAPSRLPADRLAGPPMAEVMVLGTYHMDNPGQDIFNMKADPTLTLRTIEEFVSGSK